MVPENLKYTKEHEWLKMEDDLAVIGLTDFAQEHLGDITYVELPETGEQLEQMARLGSVESVKAVSDIFSPLSGEVAELNKFLLDRIKGEENPEFHPEYINQSPYDKGWVIKIKPADLSEINSLLTPQAYEKLLEEEG